MPIIKASNSAPLLKEAIVLDLGDLSRQAQALQESAQARARQLVSEAQNEAQRMVKSAQGQGFAQGRDEGHAQGLEEGRREGHAQALRQTAAELESLRTSLSAMLAQLEKQRQDWERDARMAVLQVALKLGEKVVQRIVEVDPAVAADALADALAQVMTPMDITVRVCPQDHAALAEALPRLQADFPRLRNLRLVEDAALGRGGVTVSYGQGVIDATVETKLRRVAELLLPAPAAPGAGTTPPGGPADAKD